MILSLRMSLKAQKEETKTSAEGAEIVSHNGRRTQSIELKSQELHFKNGADNKIILIV